MSLRDADNLENQNDQRLDELHSKIRTLRGVCLSRVHSQCSLAYKWTLGDDGHLRRCRAPESDPGRDGDFSYLARSVPGLFLTGFFAVELLQCIRHIFSPVLSTSSKGFWLEWWRKAMEAHSILRLFPRGPLVRLEDL